MGVIFPDSLISTKKRKKKSQVEIALLCVASHQMVLGWVIITLRTVQNIKDLELSSTLTTPYLAKPAVRVLTDQIIDSILDIIGSYHMFHMRTSNGKSFQLITSTIRMLPLSKKHELVKTLWLLVQKHIEYENYTKTTYPFRVQLIIQD